MLTACCTNVLHGCVEARFSLPLYPLTLPRGVGRREGTSVGEQLIYVTATHLHCSGVKVNSYITLKKEGSVTITSPDNKKITIKHSNNTNGTIDWLEKK